MNCSIGCLIATALIILLVVGVGHWWGAPQSYVEQPYFEGFLTAGIDPKTRAQSPIDDCDPSDTILAESQETHGALKNIEYPVGPTPQSYSRPEHIGYRWKESWRPYYWKNYPEPPIWFPSRSPAAGQPELPPDPEILRMMEKSCNPRDLGSQGVSPQGYRYFWRNEKPYEPLCADFSNHVCRNQPYPHFCYRRYYGKCINGVL